MCGWSLMGTRYKAGGCAKVVAGYLAPVHHGSGFLPCLLANPQVPSRVLSIASGFCVLRLLRHVLSAISNLVLPACAHIF